MRDVKTTNFMNNKIEEIQAGLKEIFKERHVKFNTEIDLNQSTTDGYSFSAYITYKFYKNPKIDKANMTCESLKQQPYFFDSKEYDEVSKFLKECKVGFIEINRYDQTTITVKVLYDKDFELYDNIVVTLPGISDTIMTIGEEYYVARIKRGMSPMEDGKYIDKIKRKLVSIEYIGLDYAFEFEGLEDKISSHTRGHVSSREKTLHRNDYTVIEKYKGFFIKNVLTKCADEVCLLSTNDAVKNNEPLYEAMKEVMDGDFIPQKKDK